MPFTNFPFGVTSFGVPVLPPFGSIYGNPWFVNTNVPNPLYRPGTKQGTTVNNPLGTVAAALALAQRGDTVYVTGDIREQYVGDNTKSDITIVGCGTAQYPWQGTSYGSVVWRAPASPTADTALLEIRAQGWKLYNIMFVPASDSPGLLLSRNADETPATDEYDASRLEIWNCVFDGGAIVTNRGIVDNGGSGFVMINGCTFVRLQYGIRGISTAVAIPLNWKIGQYQQNYFTGNTNHLIGSFSGALVANNNFGPSTVGINMAAVSGQGLNNLVSRNVLGGAYSSPTYVAAATDDWFGNFADVSGGVTQNNPA